MKREALKFLGALAFLSFLAGASWLDGLITGKAIEQTAVTVVEESGHRRMVCE